MGLLDAIPAVSAVKKGALIAVGCLVLFLVTALGVQSFRLRLAHTALEQARQTVKSQGDALDLAAGVNAGNQIAIHSLQAANEEWAKIAAGNQAALEEATQKIETAQQQARVARAQAQKELQNEAQQSPQCNSALVVDLGAVCPLLRQRLLDHTTKLRSN